MKFIFIDEVEQPNKNKSFFGLGAVIIDSANYSKFKNEANKHFKKLKWPEKSEFKGRYLFSQKVDKNITIDERINFVDEFSKMSVATKNARYSFLFTYNFDKRTKKNFLLLLEKVAKQISAPPKCKGDKCLAGIFCDNIGFVSASDIYNTISGKLKKKLTIFERPFCVDSDNKTFGIMAVDILCYLKSWVEIISNVKNIKIIK